MDRPALISAGEWSWTLHDGNRADTLADLPRWEHDTTCEITAPTYAGGHLEIVGDFPTDAYLCAWLDIARAVPGVDFHARTTEVDRMVRLADPDAPDNFRWTYQDPDIDEDAASRGQSTEGQAADSGDS